VISRIAIPVRALSSSNSCTIWYCGGHIEPGRGLIRDQAGGDGRTAPARSSRAGRCRPRARAGRSGAGVRVGHVDAPQQPDSLLPGPPRGSSAAGSPGHYLSCRPTDISGLRGSRRVLEDHRDLRPRISWSISSSGRGSRSPPSQRTSPPTTRPGDFNSRMMSRAVTDSPSRFRPTRPQHLPRLDLEGHAVEHVQLAVRTKNEVLRPRTSRAGPRSGTPPLGVEDVLGGRRRRGG